MTTFQKERLIEEYTATESKTKARSKLRLKGKFQLSGKQEDLERPYDKPRILDFSGSQVKAREVQKFQKVQCNSEVNKLITRQLMREVSKEFLYSLSDPRYKVQGRYLIYLAKSKKMDYKKPQTKEKETYATTGNKINWNSPNILFVLAE